MTMYVAAKNSTTVQRMNKQGLQQLGRLISKKN